MARQTRVTGNEDLILGRTVGDADRLFPRYTNASAATTGEVTVNGKVLRLWTFQQLETLSVLVLRQRALAIRDVIEEDQCPPIPSAQPRDLVQWILHMQSVLTDKKPEVNSRAHGGVPQCFAQESKERPIAMRREASPRNKPAPFGLRNMCDSRVARDHISDIVLNKNEYKEERTEGIVSMRVGGEGRRHLTQRAQMESMGTSESVPVGIQSLKNSGEGRRAYSVQDHLAEQAQELEDRNRGLAPAQTHNWGMNGEITCGLARRDGNADHMEQFGLPAPGAEPQIGGDRRRHLNPADHMLSVGTADDMDGLDQPRFHGRKYLDSFAGAKSSHSGSGGQYVSSWKQDPSRLAGATLLI